MDTAPSRVIAVGRTRKKVSGQRDKGPFYAPAMRVILDGMAAPGVARLAVMVSWSASSRPADEGSAGAPLQPRLVRRPASPQSTGAGKNANGAAATKSPAAFPE